MAWPWASDLWGGTVVHIPKKSEAAWDHAEKVSLDAGMPFKDRHGVLCNEEADPKGITYLVLKEWCYWHGIGFDQE